MMKLPQARLRRIHRALVPVMVLPLLLTLTTGMLFQLAIAGDRASDFLWLLELHRGNFGRLHLEQVYPFFNGLGLLTLLLTGVLMWLRSPARSRRRS